MSINNIGPFTKSHLDMCIKNNSIDDALYEKYGVRKYGFHGTSHKYVSNKVAEVMGKDIKSSGA